MTKFTLLGVTTAALVLLAEGSARVAEWLHPPSPDLTFAYAPYRMLRMAKAPWPLNRQGFRARELETYRNTFLVEFLGGSVCLGLGTNPGKTVPERLEEALHRAGLERATVLNLCQGGASSAQELAIFLEYGLPLKPQVVLSFDGANDLMHPRPIGDDDAANLPYRNREIQARMEQGYPWMEHVAIFRVASRLARRMPPRAPTGDPVPEDSILGSYLYTLGIVSTLTAADGGWHAVLFQPTLHVEKPWSDAERAMWLTRSPGDPGTATGRVRDLYRHARSGLAQWRRSPVFDLTRTFAQTPQTVYSDSVHFIGDTGYRMLAAELERQGLVDQIAMRYLAWCESP